MSTYAIGDVHGCYHALLRLLERIRFNEDKDVLWFAGDLVNRGPDSLSVLIFVHALKDRAVTVLGNHDLGFLGSALKKEKDLYSPADAGLQPLLRSPHCESLFHWLLKRPLIHHDPHLNATLVHAGILPQWDLPTALSLAREAEILLRDPETRPRFENLYGNTPSCWDPSLVGWDRARFILNAFTRMRFSNDKGELEFSAKGAPQHPPAGFLPWFQVPRDPFQGRVIFAHWSALGRYTNGKNLFALDTGCAWGGYLTALRLEDQEWFQVPCISLE